jgi:hypothetical protein
MPNHFLRYTFLIFKYDSVCGGILNGKRVHTSYLTVRAWLQNFAEEVLLLEHSYYSNNAPECTRITEKFN